MDASWTDYGEGGAFLGALTIRDGFRVGQAFNDAMDLMVTLQIELAAVGHSLPVVLAFTERQAQDLRAMLDYALER